MPSGANAFEISDIQERRNRRPRRNTRSECYILLKAAEWSFRYAQAADFRNLDHLTERRKLDRSADGRIFFERQMRTASFVQVNNQIPIVRSHERSIICGIRGVGVRSGFTEKL